MPELPVPFEPHRTQRIRVEIERIGNTDSHQTVELLLHAIEQNECQIDRVDQDLKSWTGAIDSRCQRLQEQIVSRATIVNLINGAFAADAKRRDQAAKGRYFLVVLKYWVPSLITSGGALGAFFHWLFTRGH